MRTSDQGRSAGKGSHSTCLQTENVCKRSSRLRVGRLLEKETNTRCHYLEIPDTIDQDPHAFAQNNQSVRGPSTRQRTTVEYDTNQSEKYQSIGGEDGCVFDGSQLVLRPDQGFGETFGHRGSQTSLANLLRTTERSCLASTPQKRLAVSSPVCPVLVVGRENRSSLGSSNQPCSPISSPSLGEVYPREGKLRSGGEGNRGGPTDRSGNPVGGNEEEGGSVSPIRDQLPTVFGNSQELRREIVGSLLQERSMPNSRPSRSIGRGHHDPDGSQVNQRATTLHRESVDEEESSDESCWQAAPTKSVDEGIEPYPPLPPYPSLNEEDIPEPPPLPRQDDQATLDPILVPALDLDELICMEEDLREVLLPLRSEEEFSKLIKEDVVLPRSSKPSRVPGNWEKDLIDWGIATQCHKHHPKALLSAFTVPKTEHTTRLILNAAPLNKCMQRPPHFSLPSVQHLKDTVFFYSSGQTVDLRHCFYQFEISGGVERFFGIRARRGRTLTFNRMAMGWSWAPYIAQMVALRYLRPVLPHAVAIYDDFLVLGKNNEETRERAVIVRERILRCGGTLHQTKSMSEPATEFVYMGVEWNLQNKSFRLAPSFVSKWEPWFRKMESIGQQKVHLIYSVIAASLYALRIWEEPACEYYEITRWMSRTAVDISAGKHQWRDSCTLPSKVRGELLPLLKKIQDNAWHRWQPGPPASPLQIFSDASSIGWSWILCRGEEHVEGRCGSAPVRMHINVLELWALWQAVRIVTERYPGHTWTAWCDNLTVVYQTRRCRSQSFWPNYILRTLYRALRESGSRLFVQWIPTQEQKADRYTRLSSFRLPVETEMSALPMLNEGNYLDIPRDVAFGQ